MKKSITVLGVEADGIRGVRLEEVGTDWSCVDSAFWPIGGSRRIEDGEPDKEGDGRADSSQFGEDLAAPSADERYEATVDALSAASKRFGTSEVVLSMPLSDLLVKVARTPVEERDNLPEMADSELGKVSPFPDETPVTGIEITAETDRDLVTMFAALPEAVASDIADALDEAKVRVVRTDITALGWLRNLWPRIITSGDASRREDDGSALPSRAVSDSFRRVVLMDLDGGWDIVVLDSSTPSLLRGLGPISDAQRLAREVMLSLLRAGGGCDVGEIVLFSKREVSSEIKSRLSEFAPLRVEMVSATDENFGVDGVARRTVEEATLDITPAEWVESREEARFKKKLTFFVSAAAAGWLLAMGVILGGPMVYDQLAQRQKSICRSHARAYGEVKDMRDKVRLVQQYSDHARGTLEIFKAVSDRLPEGVTLTSFNYRRGEKLSLVGEADQPTAVYDFKNALTEAAIVAEDSDGNENAEKLFSDVTLSGPSKSRNAHRFSMECFFESAEEEGK